MNLPIVIRQLGLLLLLLGGALLLHAFVAMGYWAAGDDMEEASVELIDSLAMMSLGRPALGAPSARGTLPRPSAELAAEPWPVHSAAQPLCSQGGEASSVASAGPAAPTAGASHRQPQPPSGSWAGPQPQCSARAGRPHGSA